MKQKKTIDFECGICGEVVPSLVNIQPH